MISFYYDFHKSNKKIMTHGMVGLNRYFRELNSTIDDKNRRTMIKTTEISFSFVTVIPSSPNIGQRKYRTIP